MRITISQKLNGILTNGENWGICLILLYKIRPTCEKSIDLLPVPFNLFLSLSRKKTIKQPTDIDHFIFFISVIYIWSVILSFYLAGDSKVAWCLWHHWKIRWCLWLMLCQGKWWVIIYVTFTYPVIYFLNYFHCDL